MLIDPNTLTWRCDVCHQERPDRFISVHKVDITPQGLPTGAVIRNVKYCNDSDDCCKGATNWEKSLPYPDGGNADDSASTFLRTPEERTRSRYFQRANHWTR